jgi:hypothetical protein
MRKHRIKNLETLHLAQDELALRIDAMEDKLGQRAELFQHLAKTELTAMISWKSLLLPILPGLFQTITEDDSSGQSGIRRFFHNFWQELKEQYQSKLSEWLQIFQPS